MFTKRDAKEYDAVVIGSGSGAAIVDYAQGNGQDVALVDHGPLGGTCLNVGCIPSKLLIYPADRVVEIQEAKKLGIDAHIDHVDFEGIMERMRRIIREDQVHIRQGIEHTHGLDFYETTGSFVDTYTLQVDDARIRGKKIFVAAGARPLIPPIQGLDQVPYLTNDNVFDLTERPDSLVIIGGGYIGCEFGHFFSAMGTVVTILQRNQHLVPEEEPEISDLLRKKMAERMAIHTRTEVLEVHAEGDRYRVVARDLHIGQQKEFFGQHILVAAGRRSNADLLQVHNAGIETDERGYIKVNEYLETNVKNIWAFGDITGRFMFRHTANRESFYAWHNSQGGHRAAMEYHAIPHAVFTYPQIASVGLTEEQALRQHDILVGEAKYLDVAKGLAMMETDGFAKAIVERKSGRILGFHIIGPYAPILIQEVINAMADDGQIQLVSSGMHIHPALPELIVNTLYSLREPE